MSFVFISVFSVLPCNFSLTVDFTFITIILSLVYHLSLFKILIIGYLYYLLINNIFFRIDSVRYITFWKPIREKKNYFDHKVSRILKKQKKCSNYKIKKKGRKEKKTKKGTIQRKRDRTIKKAKKVRR